MKLKTNIEVMVDGKVKVEKENLITDEGEYLYVERILDRLYNKGYRIVEECSGGEHGEWVLHNKELHKTKCVFYRLYYPELSDAEGKRVYHSSQFRRVDIPGNNHIHNFTHSWTDPDEVMIREHISWKQTNEIPLMDPAQMKAFIVV